MKRIGAIHEARRETGLSRAAFSDLGFHARILGDDKARQAMVSARVCAASRAWLSVRFKARSLAGNVIVTNVVAESSRLILLSSTKQPHLFFQSSNFFKNSDYQLYSLILY